MRTIKFRGLQKDDDSFIYGDLAKMWNGIPFIMPKCFFATKDLGFDEDDPEDVKKMLNSKELALGGFIEVIPETVGQFTGLQDKNGVDIYEGDILSKGKISKRPSWKKGHDYYCVSFSNGVFVANGYNGEFKVSPILHNLNSGCEIIGNIHENPELLNN